MASIIIHRGTKQIGGCVTEIRTETTRVFIDIGDNLPNVSGELPSIEDLTTGDGTNSALFLTHYHGDHIGLLDKVLPTIPVYMSASAKAVQLNLSARIYPDKRPLFERIQEFEPFTTKQVGNITVFALLSDHSAFGAYMYVIEADGIRILHTGDFRLHGIIGRRLLTRLFPRYAQNIDYIICEGTTLSRVDGKPSMSEFDLRNTARKLMNEKPYVFVICSSTNIDRIGAFYHANPKGRLFVCDGYQKKQLETVSDSLSKDGSFYDFKYVYNYAPNLDKNMKEKGFCMLVRQGDFFKRVMEKYKDDCLVIYSMWTGYLDERAKNQGLSDFLAPYRYRVLHTSGHASPGEIRVLCEAVKPKRGLIPIHTEAPEIFEGLIPGGCVILLDDGEEFSL